jgi:hypothetical protein
MSGTVTDCRDCRKHRWPSAPKIHSLVECSEGKMHLAAQGKTTCQPATRTVSEGRDNVTVLIAKGICIAYRKWVCCQWRPSHRLKLKIRIDKVDNGRQIHGMIGNRAVSIALSGAEAHTCHSRFSHAPDLETISKARSRHSCH